MPLGAAYMYVHGKIDIDMEMLLFMRAYACFCVLILFLLGLFLARLRGWLRILEEVLSLCAMYGKWLRFNCICAWECQPQRNWALDRIVNSFDPGFYFTFWNRRRERFFCVPIGRKRVWERNLKIMPQTSRHIQTGASHLTLLGPFIYHCF